MRVAPLLLASLLASVTAHAGPRDILFFSPGSPGDEAQAQPTLDLLKAELGKRIPGGPFTVHYRNVPAEGERFLKDGKPVFAFVSIQAWLRYGEAGGWKPLLEVAALEAEREEFSLVVPAGVAGVSGLPVVGATCWDPAFVSKVVLGGKDAPASCDTKEPALKALKRAIAGEKVGVVIDAAQSRAVPKLPGGASLKTLGTSGPLPSGLVVALGDPGALGADLVKALRKMEKDKTGRDTLTALRIASFREPDASSLGALRAKYGAK